MPNPFVALNLQRVGQHVLIGMGVSSFWRGAWYILDDHLFPGESAKSALASFGLGVAGMTASQGLVAKCEELAKKQPLESKLLARRLKVYRFGALYTIAMSCVLVWRGTWVGWDVLYEYTHPQQTPCKTGVKSTDPGHLSTSGLLSHVLAVSVLVGTGLFASVLAPPAATSIVRDWAVQAGAKPYHGPAGKLVERLFAKKPSTPTTIIARNYSQPPPPPQINPSHDRTFFTMPSTTRTLPSSFHQRRGL